MEISRPDFINQLEDDALAVNGEGSSSARKGLGYEKWITAVLNYEDNLSILQGNLSVAGGWDYNTFKQIIDGFNLNPNTIEKIFATDDIPDLPTYTYHNPDYGTSKKGGRPRTDVAVYITLKNQDTVLYTISCKNTSASTVTCFEWFPEHLCDVLSLPDSTYQVIKKFQLAGGIGNMSTHEQELLFDEIAPYVDQINIFALSGFAPGNFTNAAPEQIATYILTRNNGNITFESIPEYIDKCKSARFGQAGTILSWSVASTKLRKDGTKPDPKPIFKMKVFK